MKYTVLRTVRAATNTDGTETAWFFEGEEYSETSAPPLLPHVARNLERGDFVVPSHELGIGPPAEIELETALDAPTETAAICGAVKASGEICDERKPCRYHDRKRRK